jgi:DNA-binding transcriptional MerR regulator
MAALRCAKIDFYVTVNIIVRHWEWNGRTVEKFYSITELTREFGISTRTLRFYEDEGLIHPERRGRTRLYRSADRVLIQEILRGRRIGFTISEIREIVQVYKEPPGEVGQLKLLMKKVEEKRADLRLKRKDIEDTLLELDNVEEACLTRMAEIGVGT